MDTATEPNVISNNLLFTYQNSPKGSLHPWLKEFFNKREFPWENLGKSLTSVLQRAVQAIPVSERLQGQISSGAFLDPSEGIVVENGAIVEPGAFISGPTYIASGAVVRHGAYIRGSCYVAPGAVVGHTTELKGSVLMCDAKAAHFAYVGDSILGFNANLGAGTKLANLRLDHGEVKIKFQNERFLTGLKKFGAIIGDNAQTGCNSVTNPGTIMLPNSFLMPNKTALGVIKN
jgi:UDP-N-acetylglucosamine diphosphorylase / glucose-1-phosphate thymidylyltransferase / UDP-N-acetylgalactosamine diphosphorylase / glucosamine-1-phosphate N-acetyltransferase / galactosamine-1-phosphate N-acetyltransferase